MTVAPSIHARQAGIIRTQRARIAELEAIVADQAARLVAVMGLCDRWTNPETNHAKEQEILPDRRGNEVAPKAIEPNSSSDLDVIATLRALGCDAHEAKRLAKDAQGEDAGARVRDALRKRG